MRQIYEEISFECEEIFHLCSYGPFQFNCCESAQKVSSLDTSTLVRHQNPLVEFR